MLHGFVILTLQWMDGSPLFSYVQGGENTV